MVRGGDTNMQTVMGWSIGLAGIALLGLIMLILFGNLSGNVGFTQDTLSFTVTNETGAYVNITGYTLSGYNSSWSSIVITDVWANATDSTNFLLPSTDYNLSSVGVLANATTIVAANVTAFDDANVSYTYVYSFDSVGLANTNNFIGNYTLSVLNTGSQFPTVGTIIGVALLLFILISLLIFALVKLSKIGGAGGNFG